MNAPTARKVLELEAPGILRREAPAATFAWFSTRQLLVIKDGDTITLSADDVRALGRFVEDSRIEEQL